jgi:hypothetical protein
MQIRLSERESHVPLHEKLDHHPLLLINSYIIIANRHIGLLTLTKAESYHTSNSTSITTSQKHPFRMLHGEH